MQEEATCPRCDIRVPAEMSVCPFCKQPVVQLLDDGSEEGGAPKFPVPRENLSEIEKLYREHKTWLVIVLFVLIAGITCWVAYLKVTRLYIEIPEGSVFQIEAETVQKGGRAVLLKGTITNNGEDVKDLSLRSIGVIAEFRRGAVVVETKRVFPKSDFHGEGALFHGETGAFEFTVPIEANVVTLWAEVVDLGEDRSFVLPWQGRFSFPEKQKKEEQQEQQEKAE